MAECKQNKHVFFVGKVNEKVKECNVSCFYDLLWHMPDLQIQATEDFDSLNCRFQLSVTDIFGQTYWANAFLHRIEIKEGHFALILYDRVRRAIDPLYRLAWE